MRIAFLIACLIAGGVPLLPNSKTPVDAAASFPGWPESIEGRSLQQLPLTEREKRFEQEYPGRFGRFTDGRREILLRFVAERTRKLHPTSECYKANGYTVDPLAVWVDAQGVSWGAFKITRNGETNWIYERVYNDYGDSFTDVSAWYWAAILDKTQGPWWYLTISEDHERGHPER
jgi:hypothetical protein